MSGIQKPHRWWTEAETAALTRLYQVAANDRLPLAEFARSIGRDKANVCRKAAQLGLTNQRRPKSTQPRLFLHGPKFVPADLSSARSVISRERWERQGHPRGMAGKYHTDAVKARLANLSRARWAAMSEDEQVVLIEKTVATRKANMLAGHTSATHENTYSRARRGRRADLDGQYFRSRWEANYARYLTWLQAKDVVRSWQYEPFTLELASGRTYTPDFLVLEPQLGYTVARFHEVKGWLDPKSRSKLREFERDYRILPELTFVGPEEYGWIERLHGAEIPNWEWDQPRKTA